MLLIGRLVLPTIAFALLVSALVSPPGGADAATLNVALYGTDGPSCGSALAPCRSINQAIANADAGDKIVVAPGSYTEAGPPGCSRAVLVDQAVTIESRGGAHVTTIQGRGSPCASSRSWRTR